MIAAVTEEMDTADKLLRLLLWNGQCKEENGHFLGCQISIPDGNRHNSNRVKLPHFKEGKIPLFRIGALLI
ncbi:hypothetical protein [Nitrosospira sp. NpAV]|uniref:hypothetical protein n=1 Tax=Nitrosospira sp. NpAV TaxID=58133 RepID=UPI0012EB5F67|nr:hypothetical protein [Nitrosospira sp. NpAV]